jgi:hypothetical protein
VFHDLNRFVSTAAELSSSLPLATRRHIGDVQLTTDGATYVVAQIIGGGVTFDNLRFVDGLKFRADDDPDDDELSIYEELPYRFPLLQQSSPAVDNDDDGGVDVCDGGSTTADTAAAAAEVMVEEAAAAAGANTVVPFAVTPSGRPGGVAADVVVSNELIRHLLNDDTCC